MSATSSSDTIVDPGSNRTVSARSARTGASPAADLLAGGGTGSGETSGFCGSTGSVARHSRAGPPVPCPAGGLRDSTVCTAPLGFTWLGTAAVDQICRPSRWASSRATPGMWRSSSAMSSRTGTVSSWLSSASSRASSSTNCSGVRLLVTDR